MIKLLSKFVIDKESPHVVLPICTFNTNIKKFIELTQDRISGIKKYDAFLQRYKDGDYYDIISVLISEWANYGDLLDFIKLLLN